MENPLDLVVRETNTIKEIKEMISEITGIPSSLISFDVAHSEENERLLIGEYIETFNHQMSSEPVYVTKRVHVCLDVTGKAIIKEFHLIKRYESETVKDLRKFIKESHPRCKVLLQNRDGLTEKTLLKDVGEIVIRFSIVKNDPKCILS